MLLLAETPGRVTGACLLALALGIVPLTDVSVKLVSKGGSNIVCDLYLPGDKRIRNEGFGWPGLLAIPSTHLGAGEEYTVTVKCKVSGVPWEKAWKFATRK